MESSGATRGIRPFFFSSKKYRFMMGSIPAVVPERILVLLVGATAKRSVSYTHLDVYKRQV